MAASSSKKQTPAKKMPVAQPFKVDHTQKEPTADLKLTQPEGLYQDDDLDTDRDIAGPDDDPEDTKYEYYVVRFSRWTKATYRQYLADRRDGRNVKKVIAGTPYSRL